MSFRGCCGGLIDKARQGATTTPKLTLNKRIMEIGSGVEAGVDLASSLERDHNRGVWGYTPRYGGGLGEQCIHTLKRYLKTSFYALLRDKM